MVDGVWMRARVNEGENAIEKKKERDREMGVLVGETINKVNV